MPTVMVVSFVLRSSSALRFIVTRIPLLRLPPGQTR
jgi:hypothetical protein